MRTNLTGFFQHDRNKAVAGAYYTDLQHCRLISTHLNFPEGLVYALEPSIGDGSAIIAVTKKSERPNIQIHGVELDRSVALATRENPGITQVLAADFLTGVAMGQGAFQFCFANPPYGTDEANGERYEASFIKKLADYLAPGAILVWVVPTAAYRDFKHTSRMLAYFDIKKAYRFHEKEYSKFRQSVYFLIRRAGKVQFLKNEEVNRYVFEHPEEKFPLLEVCTAGQELAVPEAVKPLRLFREKTFNPEECYARQYNGMDTAGNFGIIRKKIYDPKRALNVPMELSKDATWLALACGVGQGRCGDEKQGELLFVRGNVQATTTETPDMDKKEIVRRTSYMAYMTALDGHGNLSVMK